MVAAQRGRRTGSGPGPGPTTAVTGAAELAVARTAFLAGGTADAEVVREPILTSWTRSRHREIPVDHLEVPHTPDVHVDPALRHAARPVLDDAAEEFANEPVSLVLCDENGVVLSRDTGDARLAARLDRVRLAPGFSYAERHVGTNGIGTALEGGVATRVFGHEHYVEHLEELACAAVPVHHPLTRRMLGVVNLTGWRRDAGAMMVATTAALARRVEASLLAQANRREHALLRDYLLACRRTPDGVIAVGPDLLMLNDRARELLGPADQVPVLGEATDALATGRRQDLLVDLPSGRTARLRCDPTLDGGTGAGGVVSVQLVGRPSGARSPARSLPAPLPALPAGTRSGAVGSSPAWTACRRAVDHAFRMREWLVLEGEPGTGKVTLARAVHQTHAPTTRLRVLDAATTGPAGADFVDRVAGELTDAPAGGATLVLAHVDRLTSADLHALVDVLDPHRASSDGTGAVRPGAVGSRHRVIATTGPRRVDREPGLATLLALFPQTVAVPPLRHHVEDVAELVPHLVGRLTRGADLRVSPAVLRVLMRNRWPGNVEQLHQVLRTVVAHRRTGTIEPGDLPAGCRATTRRVLTPLEAIECDAILDALRDNDGNKAEAARRLGMSRATIYRKIRGYGLEAGSREP